jgi:ribosomal protein S13
MVDAKATETAAPVTERKIIRNAALTLETTAPAEGQRKISSIAETRGGFVVTSETRQQDYGGDNSRSYELITVEVRVPAAQFDAALAEIRGVGSRVSTEKITGQDVTEEYIDLEARIRTQKALEEQFIEIMKRAARVSDALEVQRELAEVRTEIERLEGRRRFLENQSSLSTIKVTLQPPAPLVAASTSGFMHNVKEALGDGVDFSAGLVLLLIRLVIGLIPVTLFIFLPIGLLVRYLVRRRRRFRLAEELRQPLDEPETGAHPL